jgi:DNA repair exonuclease SbcCD ATPase subunit
MRIRRLWAVFGSLQEAELRLEPGLNILYSGNETGKSTWSRFIRAMFYGIDTSERSKPGSLADKQRYQPWGGGAMRGVMDLACREGDITISRGPAGSAKPMGSVNTVYTDTAERVPELQGADAGVRLLGVTEAVFRRSAYISGTELRLDPDRELEKRIMSLVTTGEDLASAREADERLRRWQRRRRWRRTGSIPEAEQKLEETEDTLRRMEEETVELSRLRKNQGLLEEQRRALALELRLHRRDEAREKLRRWETAKQDAAEWREREKRLETELEGRGPGDAAALRENAVRLREAEKDRTEFRRQLEEAEAQAGALPDAGEKLPGRPLCLILCLLGLLLGAAGAAALLRPGLIPLPGWAAYVCIACFLLLPAGLLHLRTILSREAALRQERKLERERIIARIGELQRQFDLSRQETEECAAALADARRRAGCPAEETPEEGARRLEKLLAELTEARSAALGAENLERALQTDLEEPEELEGETRLSRREAEEGLERTEDALRELERTIARREGIYGLLGDPMALSTEAAALRETLADREEEYAALDLALEALNEASRIMQSRFAPMIGRKAGGLLKRMTAGRYTGIYFDRELHFTVQEEGRPEPVALEYLSEGTKNQVYLAVRLAVCELALPAEDPCPLILDDVLLTFDDERAYRTLELLRSLAHERQILLFTCSRREREMLERMEEEEKACRPQ